jgi:hypothetical protein
MTASYKELSSLMRNRIEFDRFKDRLKEKIRRSPTDELYIALFVLLIAELEFRLKAFLAHNYKNHQRYSNYTLGGSIIEFKKAIESFDKNKLKDYRAKQLFKSRYYNSFLSRCKKINTLRNNLYHNLFKEKQKGGKKLRDIIKEIRQRTEHHKISYIYDPDFYADDLLYKSQHRYRSSIISKDQIPSRWTLELLVEISKIYLKNLMNIQTW